MRKRKKGKKLGYARNARKALLRGLARALVEEGAVKTSASRAKELAGFIDHLITLAKKDTPGLRRKIIADLGGDTETAFRLFRMLPVFGKRQSGFTRIIPLGTRRGDNSLRVRMEWTDKEEKVPKVSKVSNAKAEEKKDVNTQNLSTKS